MSNKETTWAPKITCTNIVLVIKRITVKATVILLPLLGMTWLFGLLAVNENTAVFAWIFTILNTLQVIILALLSLVYFVSLTGLFHILLSCFTRQDSKYYSFNF